MILDNLTKNYEAYQSKDYSNLNQTELALSFAYFFCVFCVTFSLKNLTGS
jgi:hypothetical protein